MADDKLSEKQNEALTTLRGLKDGEVAILAARTGGELVKKGYANKATVEDSIDRGYGAFTLA